MIYFYFSIFSKKITFSGLVNISRIKIPDCRMNTPSRDFTKTYI